MNKGDVLKNKSARLIVPSYSYDIESDERLLIPFINGEKIGFINKKKEIVVVPKYAMCFGNCYKTTDYIKVSKPFPYGFLRKNGNISSYVRPVFGVINYKGEEILPLNYFKITQSICSKKKLFTVQNIKGEYGVIDDQKYVIVPFGCYHYISGFDNNFAIVSELCFDELTGESKVPYYGIINELGKEIVDLNYQKIVPFYGKFNYITKAVLHGKEVELNLEYIRFKLEEEYYHSTHSDEYSIEDLYDMGYLNATGYELYRGTYAQDVMKFSDEDIEDGLDGDPDAYWNID